jgi:hypothetical protein
MAEPSLRAGLPGETGSADMDCCDITRRCRRMRCEVVSRDRFGNPAVAIALLGCSTRVRGNVHHVTTEGSADAAAAMPIEEGLFPRLLPRLTAQNRW